MLGREICMLAVHGLQNLWPYQRKQCMYWKGHHHFPYHQGSPRNVMGTIPTGTELEQNGLVSSMQIDWVRNLLITIIFN